MDSVLAILFYHWWDKDECHHSDKIYDYEMDNGMSQIGNISYGVL